MAMALALERIDTPASTRFELADAGAIVVPVTVDGHGPFRFLLDTGASQSIISARLARRLGAVSESQTTMVTPGGHRSRFPVARLKRLAFGGSDATDVLATVVPDDLLAAHHGVEGLIGQDVLAPRVYTLNYPRKTIVWHSTPPRPHSVTLQAELVQGRMFVLLPQRNGETFRMIPDTGSDGLVLFARAGRPLLLMTPLDVGLLRTVSGQRLVRRVLLDVFTAGEVQLRDQAAVLVPRTDADAPDGDGLLPLHIFSVVTVNGPERYVTFER